MVLAVYKNLNLAKSGANIVVLAEYAHLYLADYFLSVSAMRQYVSSHYLNGSAPSPAAGSRRV